MVCTFSLVPNLLPASWPQEFEASVWSNFCPVASAEHVLHSAVHGFNQRIGSNSDTKQTMKLYGQEFKYVNLPHGPHMPKQCLTSVENRLIWIQFDKCSHVPTKRNAQGYNFFWWGCDHPSIKLPTNAVCCPDINIEDVGGCRVVEYERRDYRKYCIYAVFSGLGFKVFRVSVLGFKVLGSCLRVLGFRA